MVKYVDWLYGSILPKIVIIWKKAWSESCWEFNFLQKTQWAHVSISPKCGARGLERLLCLKYYNVLKRENRLTLKLNVVKNSDHMKENLKWKLLRIQFPKRTQWAPMSISPQCGARRLERLLCLKYYNVMKRENRWNWTLNNFYLKLFLCNPYFWQCWAWKSIYFPVSAHYNILNMPISRAPQLHFGMR